MKTKYYNYYYYYYHHHLIDPFRIQISCVGSSKVVAGESGEGRGIELISKMRCGDVLVVLWFLLLHPGTYQLDTGHWRRKGKEEAEAEAEETHSSTKAGVNTPPSLAPTVLKLAKLKHKEEDEVFLGGTDVQSACDYHFNEDALLQAAKTGSNLICSCLIQKGADVNYADETGRAALHEAAEDGNAKLVEILLRFKASVDEQDNYGMTALMYAAWKGHLECTEVLIEDGNASIDLQTPVGNTALMWASQHNHVDVMELLIRRGCDVDITTRSGKTALDFAEMHMQKEAVTLLLAAKTERKL